MGLYVPVPSAWCPSAVVRILIAAEGNEKSWISSSWPSSRCVLTRFLCPDEVRVGRALIVTQEGSEVELVELGPFTVYTLGKLIAEYASTELAKGRSGSVVS